MSYVPGFRYDLFVSYASEDNVDGWVERFQEQLTGEVKRLLGRPFSESTVYLDKLRLNVGQAYPTELDNAARDSALLVALLSPNYVTSDWCSRERQQFQQRLPRGLSFAECLAAVLVRPTRSLPQILSDAQHKGFVAQGAQTLDFPAEYFELWIDAVTGSEFDLVTQEVRTLEPNRWRQIRERYEAVAADHAKICKYPDANEWLREQKEPAH